MANKLMFVNACVNRERSRTLRLAKEVVRQFPDHEVDEVVLEDMPLVPLDSDIINHRNEAFAAKDFEDPVFDLAKRFAEADIIVIATPFWENCFTSSVKIFMEYAGANGVAFRYSESGMPVGLCKAKCLYYVTTRGGYVPDEGDLGYAVYSAVAKTYGIGRCAIISANGLDIVTNDAEKIMADAIAAVPSKI